MNTYFNASAFLSAFPPLLTRLPYTLGIVLESVVLGMFIGILLTCLGRSRNRHRHQGKQEAREERSRK